MIIADDEPSTPPLSPVASPVAAPAVAPIDTLMAPVEVQAAAPVDTPEVVDVADVAVQANPDRQRCFNHPCTCSRPCRPPPPVQHALVSKKRN